MNNSSGSAAQQLIEPDASIAIFSWCFLRCSLCAARSARVNSGVILANIHNHKLSAAQTVEKIIASYFEAAKELLT